MRVLHLWDEFEPQWFDHSFDICREQGIDAKLLCMRLLVPPGKSDAGISFIRKVVPNGPRRGLLARLSHRLVELGDRVRFRRAAADAIEEFNPDLLHIHYGTTAALLVDDANAMGRPFVVSFYGFDISQGLEIARIRRAYGKLFKRHGLFHVLCDEARSRALSLGADRAHIVEANLALPVENYPAIGLESDTVTRWLIPARFVEKKGHAVLLRAFRVLVDEEPRHQLTCWGGYGDSAPLRAQIETLNLSKNVTIADNRNDGPFEQAYIAQLRLHDAVLAPSVRSAGGDDEGGPALTAVLAQVAGKPVIFSNFPGSERSVTDGVEGLIVPQNDHVALAQAMRRLAADPAAARRMGAAGRERTLREFSRSAYTAALLNWYDRLGGTATASAC